MKRKIKNIVKIIISLLIIVAFYFIAKAYASSIPAPQGNYTFRANATGNYSLDGVGEVFCGNHGKGISTGTPYKFYGELRFEPDFVILYGQDGQEKWRSKYDATYRTALWVTLNGVTFGQAQKAIWDAEHGYTTYSDSQKLVWSKICPILNQFSGAHFGGATFSGAGASEAPLGSMEAPGHPGITLQGLLDAFVDYEFIENNPPNPGNMGQTGLFAAPNSFVAVEQHWERSRRWPQVYKNRTVGLQP